MPVEHLDVLIVGAGLSGVGAACHLRDKCPGKSFAVLESRDAIGGTWDLFRYPGIRSDSDMFTLGYSFRPWREAKAIADGSSIRDYVRDTARDHGVQDKIRFHHKVIRADFSTEDARWTVDVERSDTGETIRLTCGFLFTCTGYYRYDQGYTPTFDGIEDFDGQVVHPQQWPEDLDYTGKRVVIIGSGATAVTLVPAMAEKAEHVTMLQRSPTYILSLPSKDKLADTLRGLLPAKVAYPIVRTKNVLLAQLSFTLSRHTPSVMKSVIRKGVERLLPKGYDIDTHFKPRYNPWDQRLCLVPDGDLFRAIRRGKASIATDRIDRFTPKGIKLASGSELEADVVVTATGLNLLFLGGMQISVDGKELDVPNTVGYKGMMLGGVPNLALTIGYTNASWTLKGDLVAEYVCRLLQHMDAHGYQQCTPQAPARGQRLEPFIDLKSGYVQRSIDLLPKQASTAPWRLYQNYWRDLLLLKHGTLRDEAMTFSAKAALPRKQEQPAT